MNFQLPRGKWIVCQIYFRRSKHSVDLRFTIDHIFSLPSSLSLSSLCPSIYLSFFLSPCLWNCTIGSGNWNARPCSSCRCVQSWKWFISNGTGGTAGIENSMASSASFRLNQSSWSFRCYSSRTFKYPIKYFRSSWWKVFRSTLCPLTCPMPSIPMNVKKRVVNEAIIEIVLEVFTARAAAGIPACRFPSLVE